MAAMVWAGREEVDRARGRNAGESCGSSILAGFLCCPHTGTGRPAGVVAFVELDGHCQLE